MRNGPLVLSNHLSRSSLPNFLATGRHLIRTCHYIAALHCCIFDTHIVINFAFSNFTAIPDTKFDFDIRVLLKRNFSACWLAQVTKIAIYLGKRFF